MHARCPSFLAVLVLSSCAVANAAEPVGRQVHVSGQGVVKVAPDEVVVRLTVTTVDDDLIRVRESSDKEARTILSLARKHGADEKGFQVSRLQLSFGYNEELRRQIYKVERDVAVGLNDFTRLDPLLLDLLRERNLKIVGINFGTSQARQHEFEALKQAVADAKRKAQHLAELNGLKLGKARDVRVQHEGQTPFVMSVVPVVGAAHRKASPQSPSGEQSESSNPFAKNERQGSPRVHLVALEPSGDAPEKHEAGRAGAKPFALGLIDVTAQVEVDFDLAE